MLDPGRALLRGQIAEGAKFANKLWNAVRFALAQADTAVAAGAGRASRLEDRWMRRGWPPRWTSILRRIDAYDFSAAVKTLYAFVFDFCDWYIEARQAAPVRR